MILGRRKDTGKWQVIFESQIYHESVRPEGAWDELLVIPREGKQVEHYRVTKPTWQKVTYALGEGPSESTP